MRPLTVMRAPSVEAELRRILDRAKAVVSGQVSPSSLQALLLIGGYGRGEGGVERRSGALRPHNNLDLLLVTRGMGRRARQRLTNELDGRLEPLRQESGIGIDLSIVPRGRLVRGPVRVMWYDIRSGHRLLLGDDTFLREARHLAPDNIDRTDAARLIRNRGTLLLLNRLWMRAGVRPDHPVLVRHRAKAILGFGDAVLFPAGLYHWSYLEKARRIRAHAPGRAFRELYETALDFRLAPDYDRVPDALAAPLSGQVMASLQEAYRAFEAWRLGASVADLESLGRLLARRTPRVRVEKAAGRVLHAARGRGAYLHDHDLTVAFPFLLFGGDAGEARAARDLGCDPSNALHDYVQSWGAVCDPSLAGVADRMQPAHAEEAA